jgi:hypothetical protein
MGNAAGFVGQVFNLRPISIGLPTSVQGPPRRVQTRRRLKTCPTKDGVPDLVGAGVRLWENAAALRTLRAAARWA